MNNTFLLPCPSVYDTLFFEAACECLCTCMGIGAQIRVCVLVFLFLCGWTFIVRTFLLVRTFWPVHTKFTIKFQGEDSNLEAKLRHFVFNVRVRVGVSVRVRSLKKTAIPISVPLPMCVCSLWGPQYFSTNRVRTFLRSKDILAGPRFSLTTLSLHFGEKAWSIEARYEVRLG